MFKKRSLSRAAKSSDSISGSRVLFTIRSLPVKEVLLYPLHRQFRSMLCSSR